jgi:predicted dehydrogenase
MNDSAGRVALIGAGGFGVFCLEAYRRAGDIDVVAIADPRSAGRSFPSFPDVVVTHDWHDLLADPSIEVIHIATPPSLRGDVAIPALSAGKSVFVEKPLALSLDEADAMLAEAERSGQTIGIDYVMRHHPAFDLLERLASSGLLGAVKTISLGNFAQSLPNDHWMWDPSISGGILVEHGVHFFDAYGRIAGAATSVRAVSPRREAIDVNVDYEAGVFARFFHEFGYPQQVERTAAVVGFERGTIEIDGWIPERLHGAVLTHRTHIEAFCVGLESHVAEEGDVVRLDVRFGDRGRAYGDAIVAGMHDVITRHRDRSYRMRVSSDNARESLAVALAGQQAARTGLAVDLVRDDRYRLERA